VTTSTKEAKPTEAEPKSTAATKRAAAKPKRAATAGTKPGTAAKQMVVPRPNNSPLNGITDLVDTLHVEARVELTRLFLLSLLSLPQGAARPRAVLKTVILFVA
jgi:hypothetical protein